MVDKQSGPELTRMRRRDRAVDDESWIGDLLHRAAYGTVATARQGQPFLHTNTFVYDEAARVIYFHGARQGRTPDNLTADSRVCFMVSEMGRLLPAKKAAEFSCEYASVVVFGRAEPVADRDEARRALQLLLDKYFPHLRPQRDYRPTTDEALAVTAVFRLGIEQWSGKQKREPDDFPGAFHYGRPPA